MIRYLVNSNESVPALFENKGGRLECKLLTALELITPKAYQSLYTPSIPRCLIKMEVDCSEVFTKSGRTFLSRVSGDTSRYGSLKINPPPYEKALAMTETHYNLIASLFRVVASENPRIKDDYVLRREKGGMMGYRWELLSRASRLACCTISIHYELNRYLDDIEIDKALRLITQTSL